MAKKIKPVTKMSVTLPTIFMGKDVVTSYDYTNNRFVGPAEKKESMKGFSRRHNELMAQMQKNISHRDMELYRLLCREYNRKLIDIGFGMKRSVFKKLDFIDLKALPVTRNGDNIQMPSFNITSDKDYVAYFTKLFLDSTADDVLDNALCLLIPPFTEFGFCFSSTRYVYMKVNEIDMVEHTMNITIQDYTVNMSLSSTAVWTAGTKCNAQISISHEQDAPAFSPNSYVVTITALDAVNPHDINNIIPLSEMGWDNKSKELWHIMDEHYSKKVMDILAETGRSSYIELVRYVLLSCAISNYMLYVNKPVIQREPKEKDQPASTADGQMPGTKDAGESKPLPKRRTRTVGMITVKSTKPPKRATPDTVRKWKVATWKARGGIRHMKDGRMIPFRECVKHRKALSGQPDTGMLPVTLKMNDNRPGE